MIPKLVIFLVAYASLTISRCDPTTTSAGLTLHLHDVESSPLSPSYDPHLTPSQRLANSIRRSLNNRKTVSTTQSSDLAPVITNSEGSYIMNYSIGTPPKPTQGYFSTGGDLIWTKCSSDLRGSKTYEPIECKTNDQCDPYLPAGQTSCSSMQNYTCQYNMILLDNTTSMGVLSKDNIALPSSDGDEHVLVEMVFGCEQNLEGPGYVGLGRGNASLVTQLKQSEFSFCLVSVSDNPSLSTSKLNFGANARVQGGLSIPLLTSTTGQSPSFYYVNLMGISIGAELLPYDGNMGLNTGTTVSLFPYEFYTKLKSAVLKHTNLQPYTDDINLQGLVCFKASNDTKFPDVTVHLQGGDLKLDQDNMFARLNDTDVCLAAAEGYPDDAALYGSLAMSNFLVGVDLGANQVKFLKTDCTKY